MEHMVYGFKGFAEKYAPVYTRRLYTPSLRCGLCVAHTHTHSLDHSPVDVCGTVRGGRTSSRSK